MSLKKLSRRLKLSVLSEFQTAGPATANARRPYELRLLTGQQERHPACKKPVAAVAKVLYYGPSPAWINSGKVR